MESQASIWYVRILIYIINYPLVMCVARKTSESYTHLTLKYRRGASLLIYIQTREKNETDTLSSSAKKTTLACTRSSTISSICIDALLNQLTILPIIIYDDHGTWSDARTRWSQSTIKQSTKTLRSDKVLNI